MQGHQHGPFSLVGADVPATTPATQNPPIVSPISPKVVASAVPWLLAPWGTAFKQYVAPNIPALPSGSPMPGVQTTPPPPPWETNALISIGIVGVVGAALTYAAYNKGGPKYALPVGALSAAGVALAVVAGQPAAPAPKAGVLGTIQQGIDNASQIGKTMAVAVPLLTAVTIYVTADVAKTYVKTAGSAGWVPRWAR